MKKLIIGLMLVMLLLVPVACAPLVPPVKEFTLADASAVLDLSSLLPPKFEHIDAASEGLSNKDLGLGPNWSEVELFHSDEPYEIVYAYLTIMERDADYQTRSLVAEGLKEGAPSEIKPDIFGTDIAQNAVAKAVRNPEGGGTSALSSDEGWDLQILRVERVYVAVYRVSQSPDKQPLYPLLEQIWQRISKFSQ